MSTGTYYAPADFNAVCFECGRKFKASEMVRQWQGYWVCRQHFTPRQPQDFVRGVPDNPTPPWVQPMPADTFSTFCTANGVSAVPGYAMPGCATPGYLSPAFNLQGDPY